MKTRILLGALVLSGALLAGCKDKDKDKAPTTAPSGPVDRTKAALPTVADVKATTQQMTNDAKTDVKKAEDAVQSGVQKVEQKMPTSMPTKLPSFGK